MVPPTLERVLTFVPDGDFYALDIFSVREILDLSEITRIPQAPPFMRGVVNLRGNAVPVMDLRQRFGLPPAQRMVNTRIIIIELREGGKTTLMGAIADAVKEVFDFSGSKIDPPPRMGVKVDNVFIHGIGRQGERFIILLDIEKLFSTAELVKATALAGEEEEEMALEAGSQG